EFLAAYQAALRGTELEIMRPARYRGRSGTFDRLVQEYLSSPEYRRLATSTQRAYRLVIERFLRDEKIGHRLVNEMRREHVKHMIAKRDDTPGAANDLLKKIRILVRFAIDNGWRNDDPTQRIKKHPDDKLRERFHV